MLQFLTRVTAWHSVGNVVYSPFRSPLPHHWSTTSLKNILGRPCSGTSRYLFTSSDDRFLENVISSPKSTSVKKIQSILSRRKKRLEYQQTIVEGPRMVFELLKNPKTRSLVRTILISSEEYTSRYQDQLSEFLLSGSHHVLLCTPEVLKTCSDTVTPQGILSIVDIPKIDLSCTQVSRYPFYLVLDRVSDPGNVGTLLRSSLAVGASGVVLLPGCCDVWNPKAVRSAMGATFQLPVFEAESWNEAIGKMTQELSVKHIYAATMIRDDEDDETGTASIRGNHNGSQPHFRVDWLAHPCALVIGSEGYGLSSEIRKDLLEHRDRDNDQTSWDIQAIHVPMQTGVESLNAAVCGSVIMFEYSRQCDEAIREG